MNRNDIRLARIYGEKYSNIYAIDRIFWNVCYYCGDVESGVDYVPPLEVASFFDNTGESADFFKVPCCSECKSIVGKEVHALLESRAEYIRDRLAKKYEKQWKKTQVWSESEVEMLVESEGETSITKSLKAIVESETDLISRLKFSGYSFEVNGSKYQSSKNVSSKFHILGIDFDTFKEALQYAVSNYGIKTEVLYEYAIKAGGRLDEAVEKIFEEQNRLLLEKEFRASASEIATKYTVPRNWVLRTLESLKKEHPRLSVSEWCDIIAEKYVKKPD